MELELDAGVPSEIADAVRLAAERSGLQSGSQWAADRGAWWRDGVAEAVERTALVLNQHKRPPRRAVGELSAYEVARSPRSTRGATRA